MEIIAHRGASAEAPEHTVEAYDLAVRQGADWLEVDVRADAEGELVVLHDPTVDAPAEARRLEGLGVPQLTTDVPGLIRAALRAVPAAAAA